MIHRVPLLLIAIIAAALALAGCTPDSADDIASPQQPDAAPATEDAAELPEVDSDDYFDFRPVAERRIDFDDPVSEADARAWAERSGFRIVAISGDLIETVYTHERVVLIPDADGNIVAAEVG